MIERRTHARTHPDGELLKVDEHAGGGHHDDEEEGDAQVGHREDGQRRAHHQAERLAVVVSK